MDRRAPYDSCALQGQGIAGQPCAGGITGSNGRAVKPGNLLSLAKAQRRKESEDTIRNGRIQETEVRRQKSGVRSQKSEVRMKNTCS